VLTPNPAWHGAQPAFRQFVIRTIGNTAALQANLLSGDVDMTPGEGVGLTLDQVLNLQKQVPDRFDYAYKPNLTYQHIDLQLDNPILADVRVRRALLMGIDRQSMVDRLMGGRVPVANSFVSPLEAAYTPDVPPPATTRPPRAPCCATPGGVPPRMASAATPPESACRCRSPPAPGFACGNCSSRSCNRSGARSAWKPPSATSRPAPCSARR